MERIVNCFEQEIRYEYLCKKVKNVNIRIDSDGTVKVSANRRISLKEVDRIILNRAEWILRAKERADHRCTLPTLPIHYESGEQIQLFGEKYTLSVRQDMHTNLKINEKEIILALKNADDEAQRKKKLLKKAITPLQKMF